MNRILLVSFALYGTAKKRGKKEMVYKVKLSAVY